MATSPAATPRPRQRSGRGCLFGLLALPVVIVLGLLVGNLLRGDAAAPTELVVTVERGTIDGDDWRVDAVRDVEGDICIFLYTGGEQANGTCDLTPQEVTFGDQIVLFGRAAADDSTVTVPLANGETVEIDTEAVEGLPGRFFVAVEQNL